MQLRIRLEMALQEVIAPVAMGATSDSHFKSAGGYYVELYRLGVHPATITDSLVKTLDLLENFGARSYAFFSCGCGQCRASGNPTERVKKVGKEARTWISGICLDCIRSAGGHAGKCRIPHT